MPHIEDDDICRALRRDGIPVTRENWISLVYGIDIPVPWTWEHEEELQALFDGEDPPLQPVF